MTRLSAASQSSYSASISKATKGVIATVGLHSRQWIPALASGILIMITSFVIAQERCVVPDLAGKYCFR